MENIKPSRVLIKEIQIDKGVFSIKSETTHKFSASDSYKEQINKKGLPNEAPKDFKEAIPHLYYAPEHRDLISYTKLHQKINHERDEILKTISSPSDEQKKHAQIESSKKVLKEYGINDRALMIYSPQISHYAEEEDEFCRVSVSFDPVERIIFVKTELLPREKKNLPQEIVIGEMIDFLQNSNIVKDSNNQIDNSIEEKENETKVEDPELIKKIEHSKKVDIDALKQKYHFQKPKESISDILKKNAKKDSHEDVIIQNNDKKESPEEHLKNLISESLHDLPGNWKGKIFTVDPKKTGYLVPVQKVEIHPESVYLQSSHITNIEFWTKFTPIHLCKRFEGALYIPDEYAPFCQQAKCNTACGAEDGFVELSAARFRLIEESEIIKEDFKRLQQFLDRCYRLIEEFKVTFDVNIQLDISTKKPFLYSDIIFPADDYVVRNYLEAYKTLYAELTDIRGNVDVENFVLNEDYDPVSEDGLVQEARMYGLQELVRLESEDILKDLIEQRHGRIDGKFYLIDNGKMRYVLKPNLIEAFREDLYMGNVTFKKGTDEIKNFLSTTLGGGRW